MEEVGPGALFDEVQFTVIPSETLDGDEFDNVIGAIESNGGKYNPLLEPNQRLEQLGKLTHIVSTHVDFPEYTKALDAGIFVVKPSWAAQSIRKRRQAGPRQHSPDPSQFFQDVVLSCADLPPGDIEAIIAGVIAMGGQYSGPLTKLVTHIATVNLDNEKCRIAQAKGLECWIVLPHWFDDCLRLGKKINERPYSFPDPELLRQMKSPVRSYPSPQLDGATTAKPTRLLPPCSPSKAPLSPSKSRKSLNAFASRSIFLSSDLQLGERLLDTLEGLIRQGGGSIASDVHEADIYIGHFRDGAAYVTASQNGKEVANLSWLYHVISRNQYTSPLNKLLHYPVPRNGIPGFENMKISVSNYSGDARVYLENIIKHCGAEYTKTMKQDNTHLITAHMQSEKCEAAQEWNINIINHLWLEESYAKCAAQTLSNPKYTHFPTRTNLGEIAGQTALDFQRLQSIHFPKVRSPQKLPSPQKVVSRKTVPQPASPGLRCASPSVEAGVRKTSSAAVDVVTKHDREESPTPATVKKSRGRPPKSLGTPRLGEDEKENELPSLTSTGRASKTKALNSLHKQAGDIALFQKEMKRKGGVIHGGRHPNDSVDRSSPTARNSRKRPSDSFEAPGEESDVSDDGTPNQPTETVKRSKRAKPSSGLPPIQYRMMVTGDERWHGKASKESADKSKLRMLGILLTQDPKNVNLLVAPKILRTKKFVAALACAPTVVSTKYLDETLSQNELIEEPELLEDREAEQRLGFKLVEAIERARVNKHRLFHGWSVFVTKDVNGGFETYKDILALNGGTAILYAGRAGTILPKRSLRESEGDDSGSEADSSDESYDYVYLVTGTSAAEKKLGKTFRDLAEKQNLEARVVSTDWILNAAMRQEIIWDENWAHN